MSKLVDRPTEVRERIRWELQRLDEKKEKLSSKVEELKIYIVYLEELLHKVRQITSEGHLKEIIESIELETRIRPALFKLSRYLVEKEVEQKLETAKEDLKETLGEIEANERVKKDANICPDCHGQGQLQETHYVREDRLVRPMLRVMSCSLCKGKGRITFED